MYTKVNREKMGKETRWVNFERRENRYDDRIGRERNEEKGGTGMRACAMKRSYVLLIISLQGCKRNGRIGGG